MAMVEVFWGGEPEEASERDFLQRLQTDLKARGIDAIVFANFHAGNSRQIDFLVVVDKRVCHVELKGYDGRLLGGTNGSWVAISPDGSHQELEGQNPYHQAVAGKYAISDDLHMFAKSDPLIPLPSGNDRFYKWFDCIICIYPNLADGSQVPDGYKARTLGYPDFLDFLAGGRRSFPWKPNYWHMFARHLHLTSATALVKPTRTSTAARTVIGAYQAEFARYHRSGLHALVPLRLMDGSNQVATTDLSRLLDGSSVQVIGPSGIGKSHLAVHTALEHAKHWLPVVIDTGLYQGRLSSLLDRGVAPHTTAPATELFEAAQQINARVLLVIDGYNECPHRWKGQLTKDLVALSRRVQVTLLITSQQPIDLPTVKTKILTTVDLDESERAAILTSYDAAEIDKLSEPFQTSYELSIAAECATALTIPVNRADLFDAFVQKRLQGLTSPELTREVLRQVALVMDDQLSASLSASEIRRIAKRIVVKHQNPPWAVDDVFSSSLVRMQQGRLTFTHELLYRFFVGEALLLHGKSVV